MMEKNPCFSLVSLSKVAPDESMGSNDPAAVIAQITISRKGISVPMVQAFLFKLKIETTRTLLQSLYLYILILQVSSPDPSDGRY